jgi:hypothetical protein
MGLWQKVFPQRAVVTVDDAGVRCLAAGTGVYVPFAEIESADVRQGIGWVMRLTRRDGSEVVHRLAPSDALEVQREVLHGLANVPRAPGPDVERVAMLARGARPLLAWLASVADAGRSAYRGASLDEDAARACLTDSAAPGDVRAACAHALLATAREDALATVARAFVAHSLPPLAVVGARLGRAGAALVPDGMCDDALPFLSPVDATAARGAMNAPVTHEDAEHAHAVMLRLRDEALEAFRTDAAAHAHTRRFRARGVGGYAGEQGVTRFK